MKRLRLSVLFFAPIAALAQTAPIAADSAAAQAAWVKSDWPAAARAYQTLVARDSTRAQYRFRLGVSLIGLGRHAEARPQLEAAERLGTPVGQVAFRLALAMAASAPDSAFAQLRRAANAGLVQLPVQPEAEPNLMRLSQDPRYKDFLTAMDKNA